MASLVDRFIEQVALDYPDLVRRDRCSFAREASLTAAHPLCWQQ